MLRAERELGIEPEYVTRFDEDNFRPNPADEAERAWHMREAHSPMKPPVRRSSSSWNQKPAGKPLSIPARLIVILPLISALNFWALAALPQGAPSAFGSPADTNLQSRKLAFASEGPDIDISNPHGVEDPAPPYQIMAGTLISASLVTGINSDLPRTIVAQVT